MPLKAVKYIQIDDQKGILYSAGKRSLLIPVTFVKALDSTFVRLVGREGAEILICKIGEALGRGYAQSLEAILKEEKTEVSREARIKISCNAIFMEAGWGSIKIRNIDLTKRLLDVEIAYGPSGQFLEKSKYSLEKGVLTGVYYEITGEEVYCQSLKQDTKKQAIILRTSKGVPEEIKEKERIVLISRKELEEKNEKLAKAYEELESSQKQLIQSEKMATIGTLAGGVAHEINTPLGSILTNTEMLKSELAGEFQKECLNLIEASTLRCKTIVEQLLKYSRAPKTELELVDVKQVVDETCLLLEHNLCENRITVSKEYGEVLKVEGNANELAQVFTNIIVNAIDAIKKTFDEKRREGNIRIGFYREKNTLVIEIKDDGCGIPEKDIGKVFDPFFTAKDVGKGTGLGLSVSQRIIEKHNGKIEVESKVGEGSAFKVKLPIRTLKNK